MLGTEATELTVVTDFTEDVTADLNESLVRVELSELARAVDVETVVEYTENVAAHKYVVVARLRVGDSEDATAAVVFKVYVTVKPLIELTLILHCAAMVSSRFCSSFLVGGALAPKVI